MTTLSRFFPSTHSWLAGMTTSTILQNRQPRPLSFITSSFSSFMKRSLTKLNTSSTSSFKAERFVCDATRRIEPRSADGNCRSSFLAVFSETSASAYVRSGRPVSAHCQMTELVSMTRSKKSLKGEIRVEIQYVREGCEWRGTNFFFSVNQRFA